MPAGAPAASDVHNFGCFVRADRWIHIGSLDPHLHRLLDALQSDPEVLRSGGMLRGEFPVRSRARVKPRCRIGAGEPPSGGMRWARRQSPFGRPPERPPPTDSRDPARARTPRYCYPPAPRAPGASAKRADSSSPSVRLGHKIARRTPSAKGPRRARAPPRSSARLVHDE